MDAFSSLQCSIWDLIKILTALGNSFPMKRSELWLTIAFSWFATSSVLLMTKHMRIGWNSGYNLQPFQVGSCCIIANVWYLPDLVTSIWVARIPQSKRYNTNINNRNVLQISIILILPSCRQHWDYKPAQCFPENQNPYSKFC